VKPVRHPVRPRTLGFVLAGLAVALATACPSLDGFTGNEVDSGVVEAGLPDSGDPAKGFLSVAEAAQVCSYVFSCPNLQSTIVASLLLPVDGTSYSACIDQLAGPVPGNHPGIVAQSKQLQCIAAATNCPQAAACMGLEVISAGDPRCQVTDGGTGVSCSPDNKSVYHCDGKYILHCDNAYYGSGSSCLSTGPDGGVEYWCAVSPNCSGFSSCVGGILSYCAINGQGFSIDCGVKGHDCGMDSKSGLRDCVLGKAAPTCTTAGTVCQNDKVVVCDGIYYGELDCTALGGVCDGRPSPHCAQASDSCQQDDANLNQCDGDSISLCVAGKPQTFDCASLNMKCVPESAPVSAHCE
jgi:hypothetical protein